MAAACELGGWYNAAVFVGCVWRAAGARARKAEVDTSASCLLRLLDGVLLALQTSPWTVLPVLVWSPPIFIHTFSTTLSHLVPARPFVTFSHTALLATSMTGSLFFGMRLYTYSTLDGNVGTP